MYMIAHQYKIRIEKSKTEKIDFNLEDVLLKNTTIKRITKKESEVIIKEYEWLRCLPTHTIYHYGIFFNINNKEYLGGVLVYSPEYSENTGAWDKFGFTGKMLLLSRGVCLWWTPKNTASYFISKVNKIIAKETHYRIITATVDPDAGEIGTIYQSMNWHYMGLMSGNYTKSGEELKRISFLINGVKRSSRWMRKTHGTMKIDVVKSIYPDAVVLKESRKRRYITFIDTKKNNKKYLKSIENYILKYPKRNEETIKGIIYKITNTINNKIYIGQTIRSLFERINEYKCNKTNNYLLNAFNKYGFENFKFEIIDTAISLEELNEKEINYILKYNSTDKNIGYNLEYGGNNSLASNETKLKMSASHKGIKQNEDWINNRIAKKGSVEAIKYGKPKTDSERKYLSENSPKYWKGKTREEETKRNISETKKLQALKPKNMKKVLVININNNEQIPFESTYECAKYFNVNQSTISRYCNYKKIKGEYKFTFI